MSAFSAVRRGSRKVGKKLLLRSFAMFRLIDPAVIEGATRQKPLEMPPMKNVSYVAFVDPSGGGRDECGLAIGHREGGRLVIDVVRGLTGSPAEITCEYAALLKKYGVRRVTGDRYAGAWPRDELLRFGVSYRPSELDRSSLYLEALAALNSGLVEWPPCKRPRCASLPP